MRQILLFFSAVTSVSLAFAGDVQQGPPPDGFVGRLLDAAGDVLTHPNVLWSAFFVLLGAVLGVLVTEALKRFAPLMPRIFEGEHWKLKVMAVAALAGGFIGAALIAVGTEGTRAAVATYSITGFIATAAATPSLYELAYKLAPGFTDRLLKRVRGEA
jgi:hypothetical protein